MTANPYLSGLNRNNMAKFNTDKLNLPESESEISEVSLKIDYERKHSPAPWRIVYNDIIYDANDDTVVEYYRLAKYPADAALIAAAPELLYTCKLLLSYMEECVKINPTDCEYEWNIANSLRTLIAKAEGNVLPQDPTE